MTKSKRAARSCVICRHDYQPTRADQRACGFTCARTLAGQTLRGKGTPPALERQQRLNRVNRRKFVEQTCALRFGRLSAREIELFKFAAAEGYKRGYTRGYHAEPRLSAGSEGHA